MLSERTAYFKKNDDDDEEEEESVKNTKESIIIKQLSNPIPKSNVDFNYLDESEVEETVFSFSNDLLSNRTYKFLRDKDECLSAMILDDSIPNSKD